MQELDQGQGVRAPWSGARAAVWLWCGVMLGLTLQLQQAVLWPVPVHAGLCLAGLLLSLWALRQGRRSAAPWAGPACLLAGALAMAGLTGLRAELRAQDRLPAALEGLDLDIVAVVAEMPQWQQGGWRMAVRVEEARTASGQVVQLPGTIALGWYDSSARYEPLAWVQPQAALPEVQAGERWRWRVRLKAPHGHVNPGGFDLELWMWERGLGASGYVRASRQDPPPQRLGQSGRHPVQWLRQQVRDTLLARPGGEAQTRAVLAALVTGDQAVIGAQHWAVFRITGVAHLMSISGVHITMLAWLMAALVRGLWRRLARHGSAWPLRLPAPAAGALAGLLLATAYAVFSGWGVPAQRTVTMLAVVSMLQLAGLRWPWWWIWGAALLAVVLGDPWAVLQVGFWLSFVAVGALLMVGRVSTTEIRVSDPPRTTAVPERLATVRGTGLGRAGQALLAALWGLVREQAVVTAALTPLCMLFFGQVSVAGLLANLVAIPWVTLCITPLALLGMLAPPLWDLAAALLQPLLTGLEAMAAWPGAQLLTPRAPLWLALPAVLGGLWSVWPGAGRLRLMGLALVWPALVWQAPRPAHGSFELWLADVGQGSAVLVRTARHTLVYDTGPRHSPESDAGHRVLQPLLQSLGDRPDAVVLSHSDSDHTGGAAAVHAVAGGAQWWSSLPADHALWTTLKPAVETARPCGAGEGWTWDGVRFEFEHPPLPWPQGQPSNAMSCVLRVSAAHGAAHPAANAPEPGRPVSALLTGDIGLRQEQALLDRGLAPVDLLLVPHHGSASSSGDAFLRALQPRWSVVQAGYRNRFGHPAVAVRERYRVLGLPLVETAWCGAAHWRSAQPAHLRCERQAQARYWHWRAPAVAP